MSTGAGECEAAETILLTGTAEVDDDAVAVD